MSVVSTAAIRTTNSKECKDKRNLERLLTNSAGSDFSLTGQDVDLEIDYYDYNVVNAAAAPGSYLGMDPAFLVWIPPLDETGEILQESYPMHDIRSKQHIDPGSNTESPEEEILLPKQDDNKLDAVEKEEPKKKIAIHLIRKNSVECDNEKETAVEKLIGIDSNKLDGIRFVDEEEEPSDAIHKD